MKTYVVSGSASGIGAALTQRLRAAGHTVIGIDLHDADVIGDLATHSGREAAVAAVGQLTDRLDGVVPCAGVAGLTATDPQLVVSLNYFGAIALVTGLRPLLAEGAGVVLVSSNSVTCQPGWSAEVAAACLGDDEEKARRLAAVEDAVQIYPATKAALAYWARREGIKPEWAGAGDPCERRRPRHDRDTDDRPAPRGPEARRVRGRLPDRAGPARPAGGGRRPDRVPALRGRQPDGRVWSCTPTAAPTPCCTR